MNTAQTSTKRKYKYQRDVIELKNKKTKLKKYSRGFNAIKAEEKKERISALERQGSSPEHKRAAKRKKKF